jgi:hypothetical protein
MKGFEIVTVNQHYGADVDIELQILQELQTLKQMKMTFKLQHVQGHSNRKQLLANNLTTFQRMKNMADDLCK